MTPNALHAWRPSRVAALAIQGCAIGLLVVMIVLGTAVPPSAWARMGQVSAAGIAAAVLFVLLSWAMSAFRIHVLSYRLGTPVTLARSLGTTLAAEFGAATTPAALGGVALKMVGLRHSGMPWTRAITLTMINAITDVLVALAFLPMAVLAIFDSPEWLHAVAMADAARLAPVAQSALWILPLILSVTVVLIASRRRWFAGPRRVWFTRHILAGWRLCTDSMPQSDYSTRWLFGWDFLLSTAQWICRYAVLPTLMAAFGYGAFALPVLFVQGILLFLAMLIAVPGGGGAVELAMLALLGCVMPVDVAAVIVVLWRFLTHYLYVVAGALGAAVMTALPKSAEGVPARAF